MARKSFTILVTSNTKGITKSLMVSSSWLKASFVLGLLVLIIGAASFVDYVGLLLETGENKRLKAENTQLTKQFHLIKSKVNSLEKSLERVNNLSTKLRLITNIDSEDRVLNLTLGANPKPGQSYEKFNQNVANRRPASEFLKKDSAFFEKPPLEEARNELAVLQKSHYASLSVRIDKVVKSAQMVEQGVLRLREILSEKQRLLNSTPSVMPVSGWFTSKFGYRIDPFTGKPVMHYGLDIASAPGTPIKAPADGVVSYVGYESGYGKLVTIDHGYGVKTRFAHNSQIFVSFGQKIRRWDVIAAVGNTGRSSGPHSHYEVRVHGVPVDPVNYILNN